MSDQNAGPARRGPKPLRALDRRTHCVSARLSSAELTQLDEARGVFARGEYLRMAALGSVPPTIPAVNQAAWLSLAKVAGNLNQLAWYANDVGGVAIADLLQILKDVRSGLLGLAAPDDDPV